MEPEVIVNPRAGVHIKSANLHRAFSWVSPSVLELFWHRPKCAIAVAKHYQHNCLS
jgi:hypothetical protein